MPEASIRNRIRQDGFKEECFEMYITETYKPSAARKTSLLFFFMINDSSHFGISVVEFWTKI